MHGIVLYIVCYGPYCESEVKHTGAIATSCWISILAFATHTFLAFDTSSQHTQLYQYLMLALYWQVSIVKNGIVKLFDSIEKYGMWSFSLLTLSKWLLFMFIYKFFIT
jgi:hypothetical protein